VTTDPDPIVPLVEAAVAAAAAAVTVTALTPRPVATGDAADHPQPADDPVLVALTVSGALEGTVTFAVGDELEQRIEYAAKASGPAEALAPVAEAVVAALGARGPIEATPLADVDAGAWPGPPPVTSGALDDDGETVLAVAFALTVGSPPAGAAPDAGDDMAVTAPGTSSLSTSATEGPPAPPPAASTARPAPAPAPARAPSAEADRLGDVEVEVAGVLGEAVVALHDLLAWLPGVIVSLHRPVGMPVDLRIDGATVAHAEIVVVDEHYALRVLDVAPAGRARLPHAGPPLPPEPGISPS
jgi:flagellar motor switch protein FliN/FliY